MLIVKREKKDGTIEELAIEALPAVLGRLGRSDVRIDDASVSREHARLFESEGRLFIADLNSSNGTFVNNKRVTRSEVKPGDTIRLGRAALDLYRPEPAAGAGGGAPAPEEFEIDEPPPAKPAPAPLEQPPHAAPAPPGDAPPRHEEPARLAAPGHRGRPAGAAARGAAAGSATADSGEGVQVRERILQYRKISSDKKVGILRSDFFQQHPTTRLLAILIILILAAGLFFLSRWITQSAMPAPWEDEGGAYEDTYDSGTDE